MPRRRIPQALAAVVAVSAVALASLGTAVADSNRDSNGDSMSSGSKSSKPTVVEIAIDNPEFSTLVTAVTAAGLADTLSGDGPFTIFAPTNEAFEKIPSDQLNEILADRETLTQILTYHVLPEKVLSKNLKKKQSVETVEGSEVEIVFKKKKDKATIEGAKILETDLKGSNGVVHVIDSVILPPDLEQ